MAEMVPMTAVEVRTAFGWARGFQVLAADDDHHYRLRRLSDGCEIPASFDAHDLRAVHA